MQNLLAQKLTEKREQYIRFLQEMVRCDTRVIGHGIDGGYELNGQRKLAAYIQELGGTAEFRTIREETIQRGIAEFGEGNPGHDYTDRPNLLGTFKGVGGGRSIILNGHVDTMPYGERSQWTFDPFSGDLVDGKVLGLGSTDMKGGLIAALLALDLLNSSSLSLKGDVYLQSVVDEEGGGNGTLAFCLEGVQADAAVVCEPTDLDLLVGHMGFVFYKFSCRGKAIHSSQKWKGENAINYALKLILRLYELEHKWLQIYKHPLMPAPTLNVGAIKGGEAGSTVAADCEFKICVHYYPGLTKELIEQDIQSAVESLQAAEGWLRNNPIEMVSYQEGQPYEIELEHPLVKIAFAALPAGKQITASPAGNDARLLHNIARVPTVILGPGKPEDCHSIDESIEVESFLQAIITYASLLLNWCGVAT